MIDKLHLLVLLFIIFSQWATSFAQDQKIVIVYSHNTNGVLENCNCPDKSYGGLEKRAALIDSIRKADNDILLVDTGDILDIVSNRLLHEYVVRSYDYMRYDYWVAGDQDFVEGSDFFNQKLFKMSGQLLISNLFYKDQQMGKTYIIRDFGKIRLGITGTIREDLSKFLDEPVQNDFTFDDQMSCLHQVIKQMQGKTDFILLLSHSGMDRDYQISEKFPQIGLIIGGHSQTLLSNPEKVGSTYITQVGESGYRLGVLQLNFKQKELKSIKNTVILLKKSMKDNLFIKNLINEYHQKRMPESQ